jgi:hypothetical protein
MLDTVNARLHEEVLKNYKSFHDGMQQIQDVELDLQAIGHLCSDSRRKLKKADDTVVISALRILSRARKQSRIRAVADRLRQMRLLLMREKQIAASLSKGEFLEAMVQ